MCKRPIVTESSHAVPTKTKTTPKAGGATVEEAAAAADLEFDAFKFVRAGERK